MLRRTAFASLLTILGAIMFASPAAHAAEVVPGDPLTGSGSVSRTLLTAADLTSGTATATVATSAFALPAAAAPPASSFEGTLTLDGLATTGGFTTIRDEFGYAGTEALKHLPPFSVSLVQNGSHLVPAARGLRITGSPYWNLVVQPGRVWNESGDGGMTRASLPFALVERNANCTHNGLLTFLFDSVSVSQARYQITNETCRYFQFDMWGQVPVTYSRSAVAGAEALRNAYAAEVSGRLPIKPISALATDYPSSGVDVSKFGSGITASAMSTYGVFFNGVNYVAGCQTRQGAYPYCGQMLLPSYSLAKTMFHGVAFMRLAQVYGTGAANALISTHVAEAGGAAWNGVTFQHVADMATGNYTSAVFEADEAGAQMSTFFTAESYTDKMSAALAFPHKVSPGTKWVYHSSDSFILARAMQDYLGSDLYTWLREQVLAPLKLGPDVLTTVRTGNSASGTPLGGYGLFYTQDDIAKVSRFLNSGSGQIDGAQILHPTMLGNAMQRNPSQRGINTGADSSGVSYQYHDGIWAARFTSATHPVFGAETYVPFMSGYGGITVAMLPNGANYYYFSDNGEFSWSAAAAEAQKLTSTGGGCAPAQLIGNGGFEAGTAGPWTATAGVITDRALQPAHTGSWKAWLDGYGYTVTETLTQQVSIPAECDSATLAFYLHIDTAETQNVAYDTMVLDVGGTTLAGWSNLDAAAGYTPRTFDLSAWAGQTVTVGLTGSEDYSLQTSFVIDDVTLHVS